MRPAPTAIRWENAAITGATGEEIRERSPGAPSEIWSQRDRDRIWVDDTPVFSIWIVDIRDPSTGEPTNTAHLFERIQVDHLPPGICGDAQPPCVAEVEAIFCITPVGLAQAMPDPPGAPQPPLSASARKPSGAAVRPRGLETPSGRAGAARRRRDDAVDSSRGRERCGSGDPRA